jgi:hypothetical protein
MRTRIIAPHTKLHARNFNARGVSLIVLSVFTIGIAPAIGGFAPEASADVPTPTRCPPGGLRYLVDPNNVRNYYECNDPIRGNLTPQLRTCPSFSSGYWVFDPLGVLGSCTPQGGYDPSLHADWYNPGAY